MPPRKAGNGEGTATGIYLDFDPSDPDEARALAYARHITRSHGRRKKLLVLVLNTMADIEEATGRPLTAEGLGGKLSARLFLGHSSGNIPEEILQEAPRIQVSTAQKARRATSRRTIWRPAWRTASGAREAAGIFLKNRTSATILPVKGCNFYVGMFVKWDR